ncbi:MAG: DUF167 domain-containing protein [Methylobacteriaceae bacterium]|nr:DUF167 domain-containing protein [Methylobacteriaceae bacterium]MBV9245084.1 DUF167 domain-containing protein [Methylobacteriaceae bacterium]
MSSRPTPDVPNVPWTAASGGLRLRVRLAPKSHHDGLEGCQSGSDGRPVLLARVRAAPDDGKANAALIRLIARSLGVAQSSVTLATGAGSRIKGLFIAGDADGLARTLSAAALGAARRRA